MVGLKKKNFIQVLFFNQLRSNHSIRLPTPSRATTDSGNDRESLNKITSGVGDCSTYTSYRSLGIDLQAPLKRENFDLYLKSIPSLIIPPFFFPLHFLHFLSPPPSLNFFNPQKPQMFSYLLNCPRFPSPILVWRRGGSIQYLNLCTNP